MEKKGAKEQVVVCWAARELANYTARLPVWRVLICMVIRQCVTWACVWLCVRFCIAAPAHCTTLHCNCTALHCNCKLHASSRNA